MMLKSILLALSTIGAALAAAPGYVSITTDSLPTNVYLDATTIELSTVPRVVEATPGKHFVSLFPPRKVYLAQYDEAPEHFWDKLRELGAIGEQRTLLSSYEAGSVRVGTRWVYISPDETVDVQLSRTEANRTYLREVGCVTRTFFGWALLIGLATILSVIVASINA